MNSDKAYSFPQTAFSDDLDSAGTYTKGICGEKTVTLDPATPAFLSLVIDADDPLVNDF